MTKITITITILNHFRRQWGTPRCFCIPGPPLWPSLVAVLVCFLHVPLGWAQDIHSLHLAMCSIQELSKIKFYATRLEAKIKFYIGGTSFTFQNEGHYYRLKWLSSYVTSLDLYRVFNWASPFSITKRKTAMRPAVPGNFSPKKGSR